MTSLFRWWGVQIYHKWRHRMPHFISKSDIPPLLVQQEQFDSFWVDFFFPLSLWIFYFGPSWTQHPLTHLVFSLHTLSCFSYDSICSLNLLILQRYNYKSFLTHVCHVAHFNQTHVVRLMVRSTLWLCVAKSNFWCYRKQPFTPDKIRLKLVCSDFKSSSSCSLKYVLLWQMQICCNVLHSSSRATCPTISRSASVTMATVLDKTMRQTCLPNRSIQTAAVYVASHTDNNIRVPVNQL